MSNSKSDTNSLAYLYAASVIFQIFKCNKAKPEEDIFMDRREYTLDITRPATYEYNKYLSPALNVYRIHRNSCLLTTILSHINLAYSCCSKTGKIKVQNKKRKTDTLTHTRREREAAKLNPNKGQCCKTDGTIQKAKNYFRKGTPNRTTTTHYSSILCSNHNEPQPSLMKYEEKKNANYKAPVAAVSIRFISSSLF